MHYVSFLWYPPLTRRRRQSRGGRKSGPAGGGSVWWCSRWRWGGGRGRPVPPGVAWPAVSGAAPGFHTRWRRVHVPQYVVQLDGPVAGSSYKAGCLIQKVITNNKATTTSSKSLWSVFIKMFQDHKQNIKISKCYNTFSDQLNNMTKLSISIYPHWMICLHVFQSIHIYFSRAGCLPKPTYWFAVSCHHFCHVCFHNEEG